MKVLNEPEMLEYNGGIKTYAGAFSIAAGIISFILGILDGFKNPKKCN